VQAAFNSFAWHRPSATRAIPFLVGFTAAVGQIILLREVIVLFNGNELSLGFVLAAWLMWTAAGSGLTGRLIRNRANVRIASASIECLCGLSLPFAVVALRLARTRVQTVPGELIGPLRMVLISFACVSLFCALCGALFALASQFMRDNCKLSPRHASSLAYLLETAGSALGGVVVGLVLLRVFGCIQIAVLVALLCLCAGASILFRMRPLPVALTVASAVLVAVPLLGCVAPRVESYALARLWPGFDLLASRDSAYGRLTVIGAGGIRSIYDNGSILTNVPDPAAAEESVHYALLEHPAPRRVLLLGGGTNGSIAEALKHPTIERLDYVEIDPALIDLYRGLFPHESTAIYDPRVHVHETDGRLYLRTSRSRFDVIIVSVPEPANAQLNRFFTVEFFHSVRDHLAPGGLLALQLRSSEDVISPELAEFLRCIDRTLLQVFPRVAIIPGETLHFFAASDRGALTEDPQVLISRLKDRNLQTQYVREYFIPFRMMPDRMTQIHELLQLDPATRINRDFQPAAYYFSTALWSAQFDRTDAHLLEGAADIRFSTVLFGVLVPSAVLLLVFSFTRQRRGARAAAVWCVAASGFTLMTLQILLLLAFQSVFGYVYRELALLMGMLMAGIAAGSWLGIRHGRARHMRPAATTQFFVAASGPLLLSIVLLLGQASHADIPPWIIQAAFPLIAFFCGLPAGYLFPLVTAIYLEGRGEAASLATLYALDLLGGCAGALLLAGFLIPIFGFWPVAWLAAVVSLAPAVLTARASFHPVG
jgi:spermidine synthase